MQYKVCERMFNLGKQQPKSKRRRNIEETHKTAI